MNQNNPERSKKIGTVVISLKFEDVKTSQKRDGECWCGQDATGCLQTFSAPLSLARTIGGDLTESDQGVDTDILYDSASTVTYRGKDVLVCPEGHHYVTNSKKYRPAYRR